MLIACKHVFIEGEFRPARVLAEDGVITEVEQLADCDQVDDSECADCYLIPGLVDVHFHGAVGCDLCDGSADAIAKIAAYEASCGVTSICPATMTFSFEILEPVMRAVAAFAPGGNQAELVGVNMEGPYISPDKVGAQNPAYVRGATAKEFRQLQEIAGGKVKLVDVAPEEPGNMDFIREVADEVRVSVAHTCADYDTAAAAFDAGARQLTHMYNAMPSLHHRKPGPIAAAAERNDVTVELIADGVHVHPAMVRLAFNLFPGRVILISDTLRAVGLGDGIHDLGGQDVEVKGNVATLVRDGALAGGVTNLMDCVRMAALRMGIPLEKAVAAATEVPARAIGIDGERGVIAKGKMADLVVLDKDLNVEQVILRGKVL